MGKYFRTATPKFVEDFIYKPDWRIAESYLKNEDKKVGEDISMMKFLKNFKFNLPAYMSNDVNNLLQDLDSKIDDMTELIQKSDDINDWTTKMSQFKNFVGELLNSKEGRNALKSSINYTNFQEASRSLSDEDRSLHSKALEFARNDYKGLENSYFPAVKIFKRRPLLKNFLNSKYYEAIKDYVKILSDAKTGTWSFVVKDKYIDNTAKVYKAIENYLLDDPDVRAYILGRNKYGEKWFDDKGRLVLNPEEYGKTLAKEAGKDWDSLSKNEKSKFISEALQYEGAKLILSSFPYIKKNIENTINGLNFNGDAIEKAISEKAKRNANNAGMTQILNAANKKDIEAFNTNVNYLYQNKLMTDSQLSEISNALKKGDYTYAYKTLTEIRDLALKNLKKQSENATGKDKKYLEKQIELLKNMFTGLYSATTTNKTLKALSQTSDFTSIQGHFHPSPKSPLRNTYIVEVSELSKGGDSTNNGSIITTANGKRYTIALKKIPVDSPVTLSDYNGKFAVFSNGENPEEILKAIYSNVNNMIKKANKSEFKSSSDIYKAVGGLSNTLKSELGIHVGKLSFYADKNKPINMMPIYKVALFNKNNIPLLYTQSDGLGLIVNVKLGKDIITSIYFSTPDAKIFNQ